MEREYPNVFKKWDDDMNSVPTCCEMCGRIDTANCPYRPEDVFPEKCKKEMIRKTNPWHNIPAIFEWYFKPMFEQRRVPNHQLRVGIGSRISFEYVNYKGTTSVRRAFVVYYSYGSTQWHPEPQWLMHGFDIDKQSERTFAMSDMHNVVDI